jgi:hypothetical protein
MPRKALSRPLAAALALVAALALPTSPASAMPPNALGPPSLTALCSRWWANLGTFLRGGGSPPPGVAAKEGPCIDPNGTPCARHGAVAPPPAPGGDRRPLAAKEGCGLDPNGAPCTNHAAVPSDPRSGAQAPARTSVRSGLGGARP